MSPREVIARAIQHIAEQNGAPSYEHLRAMYPDSFEMLHEQADAVIDALDEMEMTFRMIDAAMYCTVNETSAASMWRAMVGAMRDE